MGEITKQIATATSLEESCVETLPAEIPSAAYSGPSDQTFPGLPRTFRCIGRFVNRHGDLIRLKILACIEYHPILNPI